MVSSKFMKHNLKVEYILHVYIFFRHEASPLSSIAYVHSVGNFHEAGEKDHPLQEHYDQDNCFSNVCSEIVLVEPE